VARYVEQLLWLASACVSVVAGCTGSVSDPGYFAVATNQSDRDVVIRDGANRWRLPMGTSGLVFVAIGNAEDASPVDYDILDPETCRVLGQVHVDFVKNHVSEVVVDRTGVVRSRLLDSSNAALERLEAIDLCPIPGS
jgi:hypothetical protein